MIFISLIQSQIGECLQKLYTDTGGPTWTNTTNWDTDDVCSYAHVKCLKDEVFSLDFSFNNMTGVLPGCI